MILHGQYIEEWLDITLSKEYSGISCTFLRVQDDTPYCIYIDIRYDITRAVFWRMEGYTIINQMQPAPHALRDITQYTVQCVAWNNDFFLALKYSLIQKIRLTII